jgi:hypothetical protein
MDVIIFTVKKSAVLRAQLLEPPVFETAAQMNEPGTNGPGTHLAILNISVRPERVHQPVEEVSTQRVVG